MKKSFRWTLMAGGVSLLMGIGGVLVAQDQPAPAPAPAEEAAQPAQPDGQDNAGRRGGRGMRNFDPARMQTMFLDGIKERTGATEEEWTAMKPKIEEILKLRAKSASGMMRGFGPRGMRSGGNDQDGDRANRSQRPRSGIFGGENPEMEALATAADSESTSNDDLKAKMKTYREAVKRDEDALKAAREELRQIVTVRQEAKLVVAGILD